MHTIFRSLDLKFVQCHYQLAFRRFKCWSRFLLSDTIKYDAKRVPSFAFSAVEGSRGH